MKLISWNVNGLRACLTKGFEDFFKDMSADIFCVQETKMHPDQAQFDLIGYEKFWNSAIKKGYSGTAIFTRIPPLSVTYGMGMEEHDQEGRIITMEFEEFFLVNVAFGFEVLGELIAYILFVLSNNLRCGSVNSTVCKI